MLRNDNLLDVCNESSRGLLPPRLRLLCVSSCEPSWINLTLLLDAEGGVEPLFRWARSSTEALTLLRDEPFDGILIAVEKPSDWPEIAGLVRGIRSSGCADPIVVLAAQVTDMAWLELQADECEMLQSARMWNSPAVVSILKRALARTDLIRESRRLAIDQTKRVARERGEAEDLLNQQRRIIGDLDERSSSELPANATRQAMIDCFGSESAAREPHAPQEISSYYHELLRTYVIMGSGNLSHEIAKLANLLASAGCGPRGALSLHLEAVESLVRGLGNRSVRHILARADLLALELMIQLGESYRERVERHTLRLGVA